MLGRVYQPPKSDELLIDILRDEGGYQFNPYIAETLAKMIEEKEIDLESYRIYSKKDQTQQGQQKLDAPPREKIDDIIDIFTNAALQAADNNLSALEKLYDANKKFEKLKEKVKKESTIETTENDVQEEITEKTAIEITQDALMAVAKDFVSVEHINIAANQVVAATRENEKEENQNAHDNI